MSLIEAYIVTCDNCKAHVAYDARYFMPQDALAHVAMRRQWTLCGERAACPDCPPLCHRCGTEYDGETAWCPVCALSDAMSASHGPS